MKDELYPEDAEYRCSLDAATLEKAARELREDPQQRLGAVQALRAWLKQQPHIHSRTDTVYLLTFLRWAKFSQLKARKILEDNLVMQQTIPLWWRHLNAADEKVQRLVGAGYMYALPKKDRDGCTIFVNRVGAIKPEWKDISVADQIRTQTCVFQAHLRSDEYLQVNGSVFLLDASGCTLSHAACWTPDVMSKWLACLQGCIPARYKKFHMFNMNPVFETLCVLVKATMNKKMKERLEVHGQSLESLYRYVPMECLPDEYLPDDYDGPSAGPLHLVLRKCQDKLKDANFRDGFLEETDGRYHVELDKKPSQEPQASFRKLTLD